MSFLNQIFNRLRQAAHSLVLAEIHDARIHGLTGAELLSQVAWARNFLAEAGLRKGCRCALLAPNSLRWVAMDLALMAQKIVVVPLYFRQSPAEIAAILEDSAPACIFCSDGALRDVLLPSGAAAITSYTFDEVFAGMPLATEVPAGAPSSPPELAGALRDEDAVAIIYTSGTSGESKGVVLTAGNVGFMLGCTNSRLDLLMPEGPRPERVFHYLPFSFAASWILLLTILSRDSELMLSQDLGQLAEEMKVAKPHYFLNVPTLLERVRSKIETQIQQRGGFAANLFGHAQWAYRRRHAGRADWFDRLWLRMARLLMFPSIRKSLGPHLKALICGSAPLAAETQLFFMMLGLPVLQGYGLTETTGICTLDDPRHVEPGCVGSAIPGIEMKLGENSEILVRGPNLSPGYWRKPAATEQSLQDGWFHTGDQGAVSAAGNWRITGRLKDLIVLKSGHNVAPAPLEDLLVRSVPGAQVMLVGNDRGFLCALIAGDVDRAAAQQAVDEINSDSPHYKQIRGILFLPEPFTQEKGLLTANGKLKRDAIFTRFAGEIDALYRRKADERVSR